MTHYEILGVSPGATLEEIKLAYRVRLTGTADEKKSDLQKSYEVLSDATSREMYDDYLVKLDMMREDAKYAHFVEQQEKNQLNDGTVLSQWTKLYRLDWRDFKTLSRRDKIGKVWSELLFRTVYGLIGIVCAILLLAYAGNVGFYTMIFSPEAFRIRIVLYGVFCGCFLASKYYGDMYRRWKISRRST